MLSLPEVPDLSLDVPHVPPGTGGCSCGEGAAGRAGTLPAIRGSAPSPRCVGGSGRCLTPVRPGHAHAGCCDLLLGWARRGTEKEAVGSYVDVPRARCSNIP